MNSNKSLDLPTQQELLTQHRCEETVLEIYKHLKGQFGEIHGLIENDELEVVLKKLKIVVSNAENEYFEKLQRYPKNIVKAKNESLERRIQELAEPLFQSYCAKIEKHSLQIFEHDFQSKNKALSEKDLNESSQRALTFFRASIHGIEMFFFQKFNF